MAQSIRLHRRVDTVTDSHPVVIDVLNRFEAPHRRYAAVLVDMLFDHALTRQWEQHSNERFGAFCRRSGKEIGGASEWFVAGGGFPPPSWMFEQLLRSYALEIGMTRAIKRTAARLRKPEGLLAAAEDWTNHIPALEEALPVLMGALRTAADEFVAEIAAGPAAVAAPAVGPAGEAST
jgi:acyl carrier protein phosphodiesterase